MQARPYCRNKFAGANDCEKEIMTDPDSAEATLYPPAYGRYIL